MTTRRPAAERPGGRERIFLSLGSNMGRRCSHLRRALDLIGEIPRLRVIRTSFLYKTAPVGYTDQRDFINGVVEIRSIWAPASLLAGLQEIESRMGKRILFRNGPRAIDIDLLLYGRRVVDEKGLTVPHPRLHQRRFVLVPLAEIAPRYVHPRFNRTVARLLRECPAGGEVRPLGPW